MKTLKNSKPSYNTVMLIDDNEIDNYMNERIVNFYNFAKRILVHTSSKSALEYLKNLQRNDSMDRDLIPDLIFLDLEMPEMNGFLFIEEFLKLKDEIKNYTKIIILTSSIQPSDLEKSKTIPEVVSFINKPLKKKNIDDLCFLPHPGNNNRVYKQNSSLLMNEGYYSYPKEILYQRDMDRINVQSFNKPN